MRHTSLSRLAFMLLGLSASAALRAQGVFETPDKFQVNLTWQFTSIDTQAQLVHKGGNLDAGVGLNFEDTFDIPVQKQAWAVNGTWRMANRHMLDVGYMAINRTGDREVNKTIE